MNLVETLFFAILSAGLVALGYVLSKWLGTAGWLIGGVPVVLFWSWQLFVGWRALIREMRSKAKSKD
jgi:hypothetical protein